MDGNDATELYKVTLTGNGISVERNVNQVAARQIMNLLLGGPGPTTAEPPDTLHHIGVPEQVATMERERPRVSLREFIEECGARRNPDRILAIGEYMVAHEGASDFGREEVRAHFRTAGEAVPGNYHRDFTWAVKNGWIAADPSNPGRYYVTRKGKDAITERFSDEVLRSSVQKVGPRRRPRKSADAELEPGGDE